MVFKIVIVTSSGNKFCVCKDFISGYFSLQSVMICFSLYSAGRSLHFKDQPLTRGIPHSRKGLMGAVHFTYHMGKLAQDCGPWPRVSGALFSQFPLCIYCLIYSNVVCYSIHMLLSFSCVHSPIWGV